MLTIVPLIYLATLDETIAPPTIKQLESANITIVTTKENKEKLYPSFTVMSFEELLLTLKEQSSWWNYHCFTKEELQDFYRNLESKLFKHQNRELLCKYYSLQLENLP